MPGWAHSFVLGRLRLENPMMHEISQLSHRNEFNIAVGGRKLSAKLHLPDKANGLVVLVHGSGSSRRIALDKFVARSLQRGGFATVLLDLLEECEAHDVRNVFDVELQASRLIEVVHELGASPATRSLPVGYMGAGTGAGTVLLAAAKEPARVSAVVSRGGRPDLALFWLPRITAPTLLIVGENDVPALYWNKDAYRRINAHKELVIVPGATHLFEENETLKEASHHASRWFMRYLAPAQAGSGADIAAQ